MKKIKKGENLRVTFFSRSNGFLGWGFRTFDGRCLFLRKRGSWVFMYFGFTFNYVRFILKVPLNTPIVTKVDFFKIKNETN